MKRWEIVAALLLCVALAGTVACSPFGSGGNEEESTQQLVEVVRGDLTVSVSGSGSVEASNEVNLAFDDGGEVEKIYVEEGDEVSTGQALASLAPLNVDELELAVTQAELALATAEYNLDNAQEIYTKPDIHKARQAVYNAEDYLDYAKDRLEEANIYKDVWANEVYHAELDLARAQQELDRILTGGDAKEVALRKQEVEAARQALEKAQGDLEGETITTLFDGVVANIYVDEGDVIPAPGVSQVTIIHLIDTKTMELDVDLDEIDIPRVVPEQRVIIEIDALPKLQLEGRVISISPLPTVEAGIVIYSTKIGFDVPEGSGLRIGMSATADIILSDQSDVLLVPDRAIEYINGSPVVYVVVDEQLGEIEERPVVIGLSDGFQTEIKSGLSEGEIVAVEERPRPNSGMFGAFH